MSAAKSTQYGRGGPYPGDWDRFDPLNGDPPGRWQVEAHTIGGCGTPDIPRREIAIWTHPTEGTLRVVKEAIPNGSYVLMKPNGEQTRGCREDMFDRAAWLMRRPTN